jgi:hypothetical protein
MIQSLLTRADVSAVALCEAGVDPEHRASIGCLEVAGFQPHKPDPEFEGMLYYLRGRPRIPLPLGAPLQAASTELSASLPQ